MTKTKILLIYTGGTIGMVADSKTGVLMPFNFEQIMDNVPELRRLDYKLGVHSFNPPIDSSDMTPKIWIELASIIEREYYQYDGFVVLHGSDTMAYSASALSFMLEGLEKPVVFTGSQLPVNGTRTDAKENLITAIEIAAEKKRGKAAVPEVCIYFDYKLLRGNRSYKCSSAKFEAFCSPNYSPLAQAGVYLTFNKNYILKPTGLPFKVHKKLENAIGVLKLYPGINSHVVSAVLSSPCKAVVMEAFGSGNTSTQPWFLSLLRNATNSGKLIVDISQCKEGIVELGRYETSSQLRGSGIISGYDMTFEAAVTKLMFLLGTGADNETIKKLLETDLRGELTKTLTE